MRYISLRVGLAEAMKFSVRSAVPPLLLLLLLPLPPVVAEEATRTVASSGAALCTSARITVVTSLGPEMLWGMPLSSTRLD
uniref:Putative secreted protein n=1 Tax=Anopheles darlingi TaxID=43151 RepID=A0A2M4D664_ANODA